MLNLIPVFTYEKDSERKLYEVIERYSISTVMIIRNNDNYIYDEPFAKFIYKIRKTFPNTLIYCDLCICGNNQNGNCRVMNNGKYDKDTTLQLFSTKLEKFIDNGVDGIVLSDMNIDTLQMVTERIKDNNIVINMELKIKTSLYDAYRLKTDMPIIVKDYHARLDDFQVLNDISIYTNNIILKPALLTFPMLIKIFQKYPNFTYSAFLTTCESRMIDYVHKEYKIDFLKELLEQFDNLSYSSVYLPTDLFK